jgi:hypothetical protein
MSLRDELNEQAASLRALEDEVKRTSESHELERAHLAPHLARPMSRNSVGNSQRFIERVGETEQRWIEIGNRAATGDADAIDAALTYLEERPRFFRSGYIAERLIKRLVQTPDLVSYADRVRVVALGYAQSAAQREIPLVGNMVGKAWTPALEESLVLALAEAEAANQRFQVLKLKSILVSAIQWRRSTAHRKHV